MNPTACDSRPRILLVEDSLPIRDRMRNLIEEAGHATIVGEAASVSEARRLFHEHAPDALVLDLQLADDTSYQLLADVKRSTPNCMVIVLTNFAVQPYRDRCVALGADHFFEKSTEFESVIDVLSALRHGLASKVQKLLPWQDRHLQEWQSISERSDRHSLGLLLQSLPVAVYACDASGHLSFHNAAAAQLWGNDTLKGDKRWSGAWRLCDANGHPLALDEHPTRAALAHARSDDALAQRELIVERPDGSRQHVLSCPRPLFDAVGALIGSVDTMLDVTEARRSDKTRAQREALLERALDASRMAVWDLDFASGRVQFSAGWSEMMGGPPVPTTCEFGTLTTLVPEDDLIRVVAALEPAVAGSSDSYSVEHRVRRPTGDMLWVLSEGKVVERDAQGRAVRALGTLRNINERKLAEAAMRHSEARFRELVELSVDWYWEQDADFRFTQVSNHNNDHAGVTTADHIGKTRWDLPHVGIGEAVWRRHREQLQRHEPFRNFEISRYGAGGALHTIAVSGTPIFDATGCFTGYRGVSRDITAQRSAEASMRSLQAQLHDSQKLEAVGTLASGIAHDFNSIVGAILGNVALARDDIAAGRTGLMPLEQIHKVALRARDLSQQILGFSRRQPHVLVSQPLRPLVEEAVAMLRSTLPRRTVLHTTLTEEPLEVQADATQIQQVLMNLCVNAAHALGDSGGQIDIGCAEVELGESDWPATGPLPPGRYAHLWVRDNGHGMDAATQTRIFEPFFTTKLQGQGTGLGLAIVRNIVLAHSGVICVTSAPGQGSTFDVYLPAVDHETGAVPLDMLDRSAAFGTSPHVLVVDDDEVMRLMVMTLLERTGYRVSCIADAREALAAVRRHQDGFDIVLTDFAMREMSGLDLARNLAIIRRDLPVVLSSGYLSDEMRAQARQAGIGAVMQKEDTAEVLIPLIHRVLAAAKAAGPHGRAGMIEP